MWLRASITEIYIFNIRKLYSSLEIEIFTSNLTSLKKFLKIPLYLIIVLYCYYLLNTI